MVFPLAIVAATVLSPIVATALLSIGLLATASVMTRARNQGSVANEKNNIHGLNEMSRLRDELKLDVRQDTLWCQTEKGDWDSMGEKGECFRKQYEEALVMLSQSGADLHHETLCMNDPQREEQSVKDSRRYRWMSVYNALNARQRGNARMFYKSKLERMECFVRMAKLGNDL